MKIINFLPNFLECLERWTQVPDLRQFMTEYFRPLEARGGDVFEGLTLYSSLRELDWSVYRANALKLDPAHERNRLVGHIERVESLFGFKLAGEALLFVAFATMDGYARFDRGSHRVFLGVDEAPASGIASPEDQRYLDILEVHELTHVARESRPPVWEGWGLNPRMTHDEFSELQPVVEHVFGEGFSCTISEILVPCDQPWHYAYQEPGSLERIFESGENVDRVIHREIRCGERGDWSRLYNPANYHPRMPVFTHYVWGWQWTKQLLRNRAEGDPRKLVEICSRELIQDALAFSLAKPASLKTKA